METLQGYLEKSDSASRARVLLCAAIGLSEVEFPWKHDQEPFKDSRQYSKEIKILKKHLVEEIFRRQSAYGIDKKARPKGWNTAQLQSWLGSHPIPPTEATDLLFLKEQLSNLESQIRQRNENPTHEDLLPEKKKGKWKYSKAKEDLERAILSGEVTADMKGKDVYKMDPEYQKWPEKNFKANLKSLRETIEKDYWGTT